MEGETMARKGQPLVQHLIEVSEEFSKKNKNEIERIAVILHDGGKVSKKFQEKIMKQKNNFRHPLVILPVAEFILKSYNCCSEELIYYLMSIYYHHSTISFDMLQSDLIKLEKVASGKKSEEIEDYYLKEDEIETLQKILENPKLGVKFHKEEFFKYLKEIDDEYKTAYVNKLIEILKSFYQNLNEIKPETEKIKISFSSFYSRLVEADWRSSSGKNEKIQWDELEQQYKKIYQKKYENGDEFKLKVKDEILEELERKNKNKILLIAPTGIGKTEISLFWALKEAQRTNAKKIIYVLPFKVLIDDLYERFKEYFGENNVDKWNSEWLEDLIEESLVEELKKENREYNIIERFNFYKISREYFLKAPIIITTADQILLAFLNFKRYPIRLGLFQEAIFVFDEIQGYGNLFRSFIYNFLRKAIPNNKTLIMTATPPTDIELIKDIIEQEVTNNKWWEEIYNKRNVSVKVKKVSKLEDIVNHLENEINSHRKKRIAVIINTVKQCVEVFKKINKSEKIERYRKEFGLELLILHGSLREGDRKRCLEKIFDKRNSFILISTQVIEAGVDTTFDYMMRLISPLPSLIQSIGRVNRNGEFSSSLFEILVLETSEEKNDEDEDEEKNKERLNFLPYDKNETAFINRLIQTKEIKNKKDLEGLANDKELRNIKSSDEGIKEYSEYITNLAINSFWSVENIENIIGSSLRESFGKSEVFVGDEEEEKEFKKEKDRLKEEIKNSEEGEEKFKEWIKKMKEYNSRFISVWWEGKKYMKEKEYFENYYPIKN